MKTYFFQTKTTMKPYNWDKYFIDRNYISDCYIDAENLKEALKKYQEEINDSPYGITVSNNAIKNRQPMYRDTKEGTKQTGFVFTGKTEIWDRGANIAGSIQYIDLWTTIKIIENIDFEGEETA